MIPTTSSVTSVAPIVVLGVVLVLLFWLPIPPTNHDIALTVVSGLLGYLSRGEKSGRPSDADKTP